MRSNKCFTMITTHTPFLLHKNSLSPLHPSLHPLGKKKLHLTSKPQFKALLSSPASR